MEGALLYSTMSYDVPLQNFKLPRNMAIATPAVTGSRSPHNLWGPSTAFLWSADCEDINTTPSPVKLANFLWEAQRISNSIEFLVLPCFDHVIIVGLPRKRHGKWLSHYFDTGPFFKFEIATKNGNCHVSGNPAPGATPPTSVGDLLIWKELALATVIAILSMGNCHIKLMILTFHKVHQEHH